MLDNVHSVLRELRQAGLTYTGSLTTNVILGSSGPELLEFNTHMGDPKTQTVMPLIGGSLFDILYKVGTDQLGGFVDLHSHSAKACGLPHLGTGRLSRSATERYSVAQLLD